MLWVPRTPLVSGPRQHLQRYLTKTLHAPGIPRPSPLPPPFVPVKVMHPSPPSTCRYRRPPLRYSRWKHSIWGLPAHPSGHEQVGRCCWVLQRALRPHGSSIRHGSTQIWLMHASSVGQSGSARQAGSSGGTATSTTQKRVLNHANHRTSFHNSVHLVQETTTIE